MSQLDTYDAILSRRLGTTSENFHTDEARTSAINLAVNEFTDEYKPEELRKKAYVDFSRYGKSIDTMEYASDVAIQAEWATINGDAGNPVYSTDGKVGSYSGQFPFTFVTGAGWWAAQALTSVDVRDYVGVNTGLPTEGYIGFWMKVDDASAVTVFNIYIGSDSTHRVNVQVTDFVTFEDDVWQYIKIPLSEGTIDISDPDWSAVVYASIASLSTGNVNFYIDDIKVIPNNSDWNVGAIPSDLSTMNRILKSEDLATGTEYLPADPDEFYRRGGSVITYDYSEVDATRRLFLNSTTVYKLQVSYVKDPVAMSAGTDDSTLDSSSDEVIALLALRRLLLDGGEYDKAETLSKREIRDALSTWAGPHSRVSKRLKSRYERLNFHSR